jgi:exodeoxyribonuclease-3
MKLISWNVNGIRAAVKKDFSGNVKTMKPDILCLQETKAQDDEVKTALEEIDGYHLFSSSAEKKGYSGVAMLCKNEPIATRHGIGVKKHDTEGRVLTAEYEDFYLTTVYVPNSGRGLVRLAYRKTWDDAFRRFISSLQKDKPVIICGDLNVAHQPIDLARPKSNFNKTAGYTETEIEGLTKHLKSGLIDTYRHFYPEKEGAYSWWSYMFNARAKNVGWRIDYFLASDTFKEKMSGAFILPDIIGSDHCPVALEVK